VIIDFRVRPPYKSFKKLHLFARRNPNPDPGTVDGLELNLPPYRSFDDLSMEAFVEEMDEAGVDIGVVCGRVAPPPYMGVENDDIADLLQQYPNRFVGFGAVDVGDVPAGVATIKRLAADGFKGIAFDNPWHIPPLYDDDERLFPLYEECAARGLIAMFTSSIYVGPDLSYCDPIHIQRVAQSHPGLTIVNCHGSWPWTTNACGVAHMCTNVYLMPDFYLYVPNTPGADDYVNAANYFMSYRLLHASSYPVRPLKESVDNFSKLGFASDAIMRRGLGGNAARILGISDKPSN